MSNIIYLVQTSLYSGVVSGLVGVKTQRRTDSDFLVMEELELNLRVPGSHQGYILNSGNCEKILHENRKCLYACFRSVPFCTEFDCKLKKSKNIA